MPSKNEPEFEEGEQVKIGNDVVELAELIGSGAEGDVYKINSSPTQVVKVFTEEKRESKEKKVRAMSNNAPTDPTHDQGEYRSIFWPTAVVEAMDKSFLGYRMPYKDLEQSKDAQRYAREDLAWDSSDEEKRLATALNLAKVVRAIHSKGHALGDYNHQNILIEDGVVALIDCDAFHIEGVEASYDDNTYFPRYTPPEGRGDNIEQVRKSDRFQLGVHVFQLLMAGYHPYQGVGSDMDGDGYRDWIVNHPFVYDDHSEDLQPPDHAPDYDQLPKEIRDLFSDCFGKIGKGPGWGRPTPSTWKRMLDDFIPDDDENGNGVFVESETIWGNDSGTGKKKTNTRRTSRSGGQTATEEETDETEPVTKDDLDW